jgi:hypothetical protein
MSFRSRIEHFEVHCFFWGFHSKHVADVEKLPAVGDLLTLCAQCSVRCAESFSVRKNGCDQMFEINSNFIPTNDLRH